MGERSADILLIEDEQAHADLIRESLSTHGNRFRVSVARTLAEAQISIQKFRPDLILADLYLPDGKSTELLGQEERSFPIVIMTSHGDESVAVEAMKAGALDYVIKSEATLFDMTHIVERAIREWMLIMERRRLEVQLQHAQRMEAIGTLAGGIAHDFNNILAAIIGYAELAQFGVAEGSQASLSLNQVLKAANRAKDLIRQILAFSRHDEQERISVAIQLIIAEALTLLRASIPATIEIRTNIDKQTGSVLADPTQIHQLIINLCTNASYAMKDTGGILEVTLNNVTVDEAAAEKIPDLIPGQYVRLSVRDTGHGVPEEFIDKIFDPYFTTKEKGVGTGLGLAVVHGIAKSHKGGISVLSAVGQGTTFEIYLPRIVHTETVEECLQSCGPIPGGNERILFVDDEPDLAAIGKERLEILGYDVVSKTNPADAFKAFKAAPDDFVLVITDQTMPQMTGDVLATELLRIKPGVPIILCTGYSDLISEQKAKAKGIKEFAMKPLAIRDLARTIRRLLDTPNRQ